MLYVLLHAPCAHMKLFLSSKYLEVKMAVTGYVYFKNCICYSHLPSKVLYNFHSYYQKMRVTVSPHIQYSVSCRFLRWPDR